MRDLYWLLVVVLTVCYLSISGYIRCSQSHLF